MGTGIIDPAIVQLYGALPHRCYAIAELCRGLRPGSPLAMQEIVRRARRPSV